MADSRNQTTDGRCVGPNSTYVKLISSDGREFVIKREHALLSGAMKAALDDPGQWAENKTNIINCSDIRGPALQKICDYLAWRAKYFETHWDIPEFPIDVDMILELMVAAN